MTPRHWPHPEWHIDGADSNPEDVLIEAIDTSLNWRALLADRKRRKWALLRVLREGSEQDSITAHALLCHLYGEDYATSK